jgi:hypothetical protein
LLRGEGAVFSVGDGGRSEPRPYKCAARTVLIAKTEKTPAGRRRYRDYVLAAAMALRSSVSGLSLASQLLLKIIVGHLSAVNLGHAGKPE